ncbi:hypothetical protein BG006_003049 [Podila minutissima]|uniref:SAC domain-containing protein n=1 Tax=Podila minutissima TaxID=64525 RepID=A0A9P5VNP3_9FUNG|nr:hypothetical protein BG006_003049 [Podila minutissima]
MTTHGLKTTTAQGSSSLSPLLSFNGNQVKPVRPYARLVLTVEHDCFILAPCALHPHDHAPGATPPEPVELALNDTDITKAIRVKYIVESPDVPPKSETVESSKENSGSYEPTTPSRISFLTPGSYTRSSSARDYIVYGCIGLLDLYTGPHLIVITTAKPLGEIEDKPVFAVDKVAILPMDANEACHILDRLALFLDPTTKNPPEIAVKPVEEEHIPEPSEPREDLPILKSPMIKFSFLGIKQEEELHKSVSSPSLPSVVPSNDSSSGNSTSSAKMVSFEIPALHLGRRSSTDLTVSKEIPGAVSAPSLPMAPLSPTRSSSPGFFTKLKESMSDKKSRKSSLEIHTSISQPPRMIGHVDAIREAREGAMSPSSTPPETPITTDDITQEPRSPLDTAKEFVVNATKQLTNRSEGVLKSSTSFSLTKTGSESVENLTKETAATQDLSEEEQEKNKTLDRRIIREICSLFGTGFYFSIEFNLFSSMQKRSEMSADGVSASRKHAQIEPLWKQVDPRFWWNENLLKEFLDIEANGYIMPVMQGYVETEPCEIEEQAFEFTLISRRSKERSGLRYQRRGINEHGNTANFVETEQLLRIVRDDSDHQVSFVQTRGSIPLFWSQSPYRLKPVPIMERTEQENMDGFKKHVDTMMNTYGRQICISLVEKHGRELVAGSAYTRYIEKLAEPNVRYVEFDFHEQCKGMKYENIDQLIKSLEVPIHELGYCWLAPRHDSDMSQNSTQNKDSEHFQRLYDQKGVIRTNCMDCLDRTNVVQSAIGRHILNHQLLRLGIASFPDKSLSVYEDFENVFNNVWANNGDAISREYAGTSALKGDFTRTGKRNLQGMVNDATNSIARMYQNTFKDYFRQAAIDYLLGETDVNVFKNLQTTPFGTVVVPPPILPPPPPQEVAQTEDEKVDHGPKGVPPALLPSLMAKSSSFTSLSISAITDQDASSITHVIGSEEEKAIQQETWVRIRETAAEIVISPGEERWKGWTFICCSNEISSALISASSPHSSPHSTTKQKSNKKAKVALFKDEHDDHGHGEAGDPAMFYDEKIVLLTERALYICTYDYEMEKVLEFWRLALEKMTGIDKGAFFMTSLDKTPLGQNPLENAGFAIVYRANSEGETLRVNSGSVRNRRMMGSVRPNFDMDLEKVQEELGEDEANQGSGQGQSTVSNGVEEGYHFQRSPTVKSLLKDEQKDIRSVRFKIVKHPEISVVPYMTSPEVGDADRIKANPVGYRRTAQDCVEWVVTEIVQARCELISVAEKSTLPSSSDGFETPPSRGRESVGSGRHGRSPSEEYNYRSPKDRRRSSVQVDLVIRDRVLQSLETAAQLEGAPVAPADACDKKKSRKTFSRLFSSRDKMDAALGAANSAAPQSSSGQLSGASKASNRSWLTKARKFQFGQDTDEESDDAKLAAATPPPPALVVEQNIALSAADDSPAVLAVEASMVSVEGLEHGQVDEPRTSLDPGARPPNSTNVFAKIRQVVKNF